MFVTIWLVLRWAYLYGRQSKYCTLRWILWSVLRRSACLYCLRNILCIIHSIPIGCRLIITIITIIIIIFDAGSKKRKIIVVKSNLGRKIERWKSPLRRYWSLEWCCILFSFTGYFPIILGFIIIKIIKEIILIQFHRPLVLANYHLQKKYFNFRIEFLKYFEIVLGIWMIVFGIFFAVFCCY